MLMRSAQAVLPNISNLASFQHGMVGGLVGNDNGPSRSVCMVRLRTVNHMGAEKNQRTCGYGQRHLLRLVKTIRRRKEPTEQAAIISAGQAALPMTTSNNSQTAIGFSGLVKGEHDVG